MVFQDPLTSLHPMLSIGTQLTEHVRLHERVSRTAAHARARRVARRGADPRSRARPRSRSRTSSRAACASDSRSRSRSPCRPRLLIADEPTTALDVTVQAGILRLLDRLRRENGLSVILITHDLGVLSSIADRVSVFYAGRIVEAGTVHELLARPRHPYTRALIDALPHPEAEGGAELIAIAGAPPTPSRRPAGCAFHPRCTFAEEDCRVSVPPLVRVEEGRLLACPPDPLRAPSLAAS